MTREEIEAQKCNPDLIDELCFSIVKEMQKSEFSLEYIKKKLSYLNVFVDGLTEKFNKEKKDGYNI